MSSMEIPEAARGAGRRNFERIGGIESGALARAAHSA
jgi:hypothetical protein